MISSVLIDETNIRVVFTSTAFISNVTTSITSAVHVRSAATIICTVILTATVASECIVGISWSKDGQQLHSNPEMAITSSNATATLFQSNLTIHSLETTDSGYYSCHAELLSVSTYKPVSIPTTSTIHLDVEGISLVQMLTSQNLFQIRHTTYVQYLQAYCSS